MKLIIFLFAIFALVVNATNQDPQCLVDLKNKQVCKENDSLCSLQLGNFNKCIQQCADQNSQDQYANTLCVINNCKSSNATVIPFYWDVVECLQSSTVYDPKSPEINSENCLTYLNNMETSQTICKQGDTDCIAAAKSLKDCYQTCKSQNGYDQRLSCVKNTCSSKNEIVQSFLNDLLKCQSSTNSRGSTTNSSIIALQITILFISLFILM
ncbi:hypothetical protein TTHERM_00685890 (macronuclear) [Tetrahymena thermophila SB210]|uniref:Transmembrane protein n=1 Tax=Tetrahymena thermophila (strain SB210) TaxID=312017 RepID=I7LXM7_TETTS|nr:hypothetical protein TTHERM_00685890 [Tetrahymena thermophila SB210]EAS04946.1 hypothetical protein TTHERM_00685890 [Tetrahymena thermophila SB210]|eukprot:XP_001025191.1 hypothetical protein TTHERM_00685890 [Tetrahymena thermophila SB210]